jgi:hypothetical protein
MSRVANLMTPPDQAVHEAVRHLLAASLTTEARPMPLLVATLISLLLALMGIAIVRDFRGVRSTAKRNWERRHGPAVAKRSNVVAIAVGAGFLAAGGFLFVAAVDAFVRSLA